MQPPTKRRKTEPSVVEEINFDTAARQEYLTGFHKRKLQRAKHAREIAEKKVRAERIEERKRVCHTYFIWLDLTLTHLLQLREERKADLERHVQEVNALLKPVSHTDSEDENAEDSEENTEWEGIEEPTELNHEAEYIDEDRYTTVTVEAMDVTREGLSKPEEGFVPQLGAEGEIGIEESSKLEGKPAGKRIWTKEKPKDQSDHPKKKKKKFRYESKAERKFTRVKEKMKNSKQASARREK